jgi:hypothetical protein
LAAGLLAAGLAGVAAGAVVVDAGALLAAGADDELCPAGFGTVAGTTALLGVAAGAAPGTVADGTAAGSAA